MQVTNVAASLQLVAGEPGPPWRILLLDGSVLEQPSRFRAEPTSGGVALRWATERGDVVRATVTLPPGEPNARFEVVLEPVKGSPPEAIEYPLIAGIGPLTGDDDRLLHSYATGFLFANPLTLFRPDGEPRERGLLHSPYPEGFSGSTLQLMSYYALGRGGFGFYFASEDATGAQKWLNFFKDRQHLRAAVAHGSADLDLGIAPPYPVVVGALIEGTWAEAADRYKAWAVTQHWCSRGPVGSRPDRPRWLHEDVGIATFGINASHDRSRWLRELSRIAGTPVLHVLGP